MNQKKLDPSEADLLSSANEARRWEKAILESNVDKVPPNWHTRDDIQKMLGWKKSKAIVWLRESMSKGIVEKKDFLVFEDGKKIVKPHYFLK